MEALLWGAHPQSGHPFPKNSAIGMVRWLRLPVRKPKREKARHILQSMGAGIQKTGGRLTLKVYFNEGMKKSIAFILKWMGFGSHSFNQ